MSDSFDKLREKLRKQKVSEPVINNNVIADINNISDFSDPIDKFFGTNNDNLDNSEIHQPDTKKHVNRVMPGAKLVKGAPV